jgi:periplasmic protein TonB
MASATTSDFVATATKVAATPFSLIEQKSLPARLAEELGRAWHELARDPRGFVRGLFADDTRDAKRRRRLYFGLAGALVVHALLLTVIVVIGWRSLAASKDQPEVIMLPGLAPVPPRVEEPTANIPHGEKTGGGSGGLPHSAPATKGPLPPSSPRPQMVNPSAPSKPLPSLPVQATVVGPDSPPPPVSVQPGIPTGAIAEAPAPGEGPRGGLGGGPETGAGTGSGPGGGPGKSGGKGATDGNIGLPGGKNLVGGPIPFNRLKDFPGNTGITWIRRPHPIITPEAQANKVRGEVWLKATFNADGTITDIEVLHDVPYMTESAKEALVRSRFRPATVNGQAVTLIGVPVRINVTAELQ